MKQVQNFVNQVVDKLALIGREYGGLVLKSPFHVPDIFLSRVLGFGRSLCTNWSIFIPKDTKLTGR